MSFLVFLLFNAASAVFSQNVDTLNILHTSDIHVLYAVDDFNPVLADVHRHNSSNLESVNLFFQIIPKSLKADAVIITGDLVDVYEGESKSKTMLSSQIGQFRSLYDRCPVPLYLTLGNHDITSYAINNVDHKITESQTNADKARASWIRNIVCFENGTYYSRVFAVGHTNYHFIFLDNGYSLHDGGRVIDKTQFDWLKEQVSQAGSEPVMLFFHIYFSVGDLNGDGIAFKDNGPTDWPTEKQCSEGLLKLVNENKNIKAMVVGHGHSNIFEGIKFPSGHKVYQIETGSVSEGSTNWRLFRFTEKEIIVAHPGSKKVELTIKLNDREN